MLLLLLLLLLLAIVVVVDWQRSPFASLCQLAERTLRTRMVMGSVTTGCARAAGQRVSLVAFGWHGARSVAVSYKPSMLVTRVRLPACASSPAGWMRVWLWLFCFALGGCGNSAHWGLNPGPSVYKTDALPLSYRGVGFRRRGGIEALHVFMPRELKSRPGTSPTHPGCSRAAPICAVLVSCFVGSRLFCESDSEGIRTPAGRAQWISSPSP